jgi:hypothetical protein
MPDVCRPPFETTGSHDLRAVSTWDTIAGFVSQYFDEDVQSVVERVPRRSVLSISTKEPVIVKIDPENRPAKVQSKKILRECAILDIELDVDRIKQKIISSLKNTIEYKLALNIKTIKEDSLSFCTVCDIYVAEGEEYKLDLTAGEKAVYLTFMLYKDGIRIKETAESSFRSITQKIYNQLPDDNKCEKTAGGILDTGDVIYDVYEKTLRGDISNIRAEIADKIANPLIAQDFAIEGFKDKEFGISNSTPELRAQIKQAFDL